MESTLCPAKLKEPTAMMLGAYRGQSEIIDICTLTGIDVVSDSTQVQQFPGCCDSTCELKYWAGLQAAGQCLPHLDCPPPPHPRLAVFRQPLVSHPTLPLGLFSRINSSALSHARIVEIVEPQEQQRTQQKCYRHGAATTNGFRAGRARAESPRGAASHGRSPRSGWWCSLGLCNPLGRGGGS